MMLWYWFMPDKLDASTRSSRPADACARTDTIVQSILPRACSLIVSVYRIRYIASDRFGYAQQIVPGTKEFIMTLDKVLYTARTHTTGGRDGGKSRADDGRLEVGLSIPGTPGTGTNPEQLFAAGWSACFIGAMKIAAAKAKVKMPADAAIDAEVDLCLTGEDYFLQARLNISLPGLEHDVAKSLAAAAHQTCPYSKATRGNIDVVINVV
jgi:lipoyl-dependent peroxiredoxin